MSLLKPGEIVFQGQLGLADVNRSVLAAVNLLAREADNR